MRHSWGKREIARSLTVTKKRWLDQRCEEVVRAASTEEAGVFRLESIRVSMGHRSRCPEILTSTAHSVCSPADIRIFRQRTKLDEGQWNSSWQGQDRGRPDEQVSGLKDVASIPHDGRVRGLPASGAGSRPLIKCKPILLSLYRRTGPSNNTVGNRQPKFAKR